MAHDSEACVEEGEVLVTPWKSATLPSFAIQQSWSSYE